MPTEQRVRRDEDRAPALARQDPTRGGEKRPIGGTQRWASELATNDGELVAEHQDLKLLELARAAAEHDQLEQAPQTDVEH